MVPSCCLVCNVSKFADSSLRSALTNFAAPPSNELIRFVVKSNLSDNTAALEPIVAAEERSVDRALSRSLIAFSIFASATQLADAVTTERPDESDEIPDTVSVELPSSLNETFKLAGDPLIKFAPLASPKAEL